MPFWGWSKTLPEWGSWAACVQRRRMECSGSLGGPKIKKKKTEFHLHASAWRSLWLAPIEYHIEYCWKLASNLDTVGAEWPFDGASDWSLHDNWPWQSRGLTRAEFEMIIYRFRFRNSRIVTIERIMSLKLSVPNFAPLLRDILQYIKLETKSGRILPLTYVTKYDLT